MAYLISAQSVSGSGAGRNNCFAHCVEGSPAAYVLLECSGNSASATLWANAGDDDRSWLPVTSWAMSPNTTATAQLTTFYYKVMGTVDWASGGPDSGTVSMQYAPLKRL